MICASACVDTCADTCACVHCCFWNHAGLLIITLDWLFSFVLVQYGLPTAGVVAP